VLAALVDATEPEFPLSMVHHVEFDFEKAVFVSSGARPDESEAI
jgi:hypothetical protein